MYNNLPGTFCWRLSVPPPSKTNAVILPQLPKDNHPYCSSFSTRALKSTNTWKCEGLTDAPPRQGCLVTKAQTTRDSIADGNTSCGLLVIVWCSLSDQNKRIKHRVAWCPSCTLSHLQGGSNHTVPGERIANCGDTILVCFFFLDRFELF